MMIYSETGLGVSALLIGLFCLLTTAFTGQKDSRHHKGFVALCADVTLCAALSIVTAAMHRFSPDLLSVSVVRMMLDAAHLLKSYILLRYFLEIFGSKMLRERVPMCAIDCPVIMLEALLVTNPWTGLFYYSTGSAFYHGPMWLLLILIPGMYYAGTILYIFLHVNALPYRSFGYLCVGFALSVAGEGINLMTDYPEVETFFDSVSCLLLIFTLENFDKLLDPAMKTFNRATMDSEIRRMAVIRQKFTAIDIRVLSKDGYSGFLSDTGRRKIDSETAGLLLTVLSSHQIFYYDLYHFVALTENTDEEYLRLLIQRIRTAISGEREVRNITVRIHPVITPIRWPEDTADVEQLMTWLANDSHVLNMAGSDKGPVENLAMMSRYTEIEDAIGRAAADHTFYLDYQPIYDRQTHAVHHLEVYLRMNDPLIGKVSPSEIIPIAEQNGMIGEVGRQVLNRCCQTIRQYYLDSYGITQYHINLSPYQLMEDDMAERFSAITDRWDISPSNFSLEVCESEILGSSQFAMKTLHELHAAGFNLIFDNFGQASTNIIQVLKRNYDGVKIDRSVLWNAIDDPNRRDLMQIMITALKNNGKMVYQTGVETEEEYAFARKCGCDYVEGFLFSHPVREDKLQDELQTLQDGSKISDTVKDTRIPGIIL